MITEAMVEAAREAFGFPCSHTAMRRALEAAERAAWQPIETAPKDGTPADVWCVNHSAITTGAGRVPECHFFDGRWHRYTDDGGTEEVHNATHWRPPPSPPTDGGKQ